MIDERPSHAAELRIDLAAIVSNWRLLSRIHAAGPVAAVVKADAYGLGAARIAPVLEEAGCRHFFVAHLAEAVRLRAALPRPMIAALNGLWPGDAATYAAHGVWPVLGSLREIADWRGEALLHVDTGINRLGLDAADVATLASEPARRARIEIRYLMTHLVSAERPDDAINARQAERFAAACALLDPAAPRSIANSSGIFLGASFASDLARPGAALYGVNPTPGRPNPMRPAMTLRARILQTRTLRPGDAVGYNATWSAGRESRVGVVSVGYADGFMRALGNRAEASFDGVRAPLVGRVSMDLTTFDLTGTAAREGDWLELIGPDVGIDETARRAGTNGYEILTSLGSRYARSFEGA